MEKEEFKTWVVSCLVETTSPLSIKVILLVDIILSKRSSFIVFQKEFFIC